MAKQPTHKTSYYFLEILLLILWALSLAQSILFYYSGEYPLHLNDELEENWNLFPIFSLTENTGTCNFNNNNKTDWIFDKFVGTVEGCDCTNTTNEKVIPKVYRSNCSEPQVQSNCFAIDRIEPFKILKFQNKKFCIQKAEKSYLDYLKYSVAKGKWCRPLYKRCGILDSRDQVLCIEMSSPCPVNKIVIDNKEEGPNDFSYTTIQLSANKYFHFTNEAIDNPIIISFKYSEGLPCSNPQYSNSKYPKYILETNFNSNFCRNVHTSITFDNRYDLLYNSTKYDYYTDNNILSQILSLPLYYEFYLDADYSWYTRNYIGIDKDCVESTGFNWYKLKNLFENFKLTKNVIKWLLFSIGTQFIFVSAWIVFEKQTKYKYHNEWCGYISNLIAVVISLFVIIGGCIICVYSGEEHINFICGDDIFNNTLNTVKNNFTKLFTFGIVIIVLNCIVCVCILFQYYVNTLCYVIGGDEIIAMKVKEQELKVEILRGAEEEGKDVKETCGSYEVDLDKVYEEGKFSDM